MPRRSSAVVSRRVLLVSPTLSGNAVGRTYSVWLCAQELGWSVRVVGPAGRLWPPLVGSSFAESVVDCEWNNGRLLAEVSRCDLVISIKPLPESFGLSLRLMKTVPRPHIVDIDDADLQLVLRNETGYRAVTQLLRRPVTRTLSCGREWLLHQQARLTVSTVGNPALQSVYGGHLLPHVRQDISGRSPHVTSSPHVVFIGTPKPRKGIEELRDAVAVLAREGFKLTITGRGSSRGPWETWIPETTLDEGVRLVGNADIVALPSRDSRYTRHQLPVKLVDAMLASRAVVAADLPPMRWAIGCRAGVMVQPGNADSLVRGLRAVQSPRSREAMGAAARERALAMFVPSRVSPVLEDAAMEADELFRQTSRLGRLRVSVNALGPACRRMHC